MIGQDPVALSNSWKMVHHLTANLLPWQEFPPFGGVYYADIIHPKSLNWPTYLGGIKLADVISYLNLTLNSAIVWVAKKHWPPVYLYKIASLVFGPLVIGIPSYTRAPATQQWFTPKSHVGDLAVPSKNGGIAMGLWSVWNPFCLLHVAQQSRGFRVSNFLWKNWRRNPRHCCHQQCKEDVRLAGTQKRLQERKKRFRYFAASIESHIGSTLSETKILPL